jgi:hypothetical protein
MCGEWGSGQSVCCLDFELFFLNWQLRLSSSSMRASQFRDAFAADRYLASSGSALGRLNDLLRVIAVLKFVAD